MGTEPDVHVDGKLFKMTGSEIVRVVHEITALRSKDERRAALSAVPADFQPLVRLQCVNVLNLAHHWQDKIEDGFPFQRAPDGIKDLLYHVGIYVRPESIPLAAPSGGQIGLI